MKIQNGKWKIRKTNNNKTHSNEKQKTKKKRSVSRQARCCGCERDKERGRSATEFNGVQRSSTAVARWSAMAELNGGGGLISTVARQNGA